MAVQQKNLAFILSSANKCRVTITPEGSTDSFVINNIVDGQVTLTKGLRQPMDPDVNEGELLEDVRAGNQTPSYIEFDAKCTSEGGVDTLEDWLSQEETAGVMPKFTVVLEKFEGSDETAGLRYTCANMVRADPNYVITPGQQHDAIKCRFMSPTKPAKTVITA